MKKKDKNKKARSRKRSYEIPTIVKHGSLKAVAQDPEDLLPPLPDDLPITT